MFTDLTDLFKVRLKYDRDVNHTDLIMWSDELKSKLGETNGIKLQVQGTGGDYIPIVVSSGNVVMSNAQAALTNISIEFYNVGGGTKGDPGEQGAFFLELVGIKRRTEPPNRIHL